MKETEGWIAKLGKTLKNNKLAFAIGAVVYCMSQEKEKEQPSRS